MKQTIGLDSVCHKLSDAFRSLLIIVSTSAVYTIILWDQKIVFFYK